MKNELAIFQGNEIRRTWYNNEWWFVIIDVIQVLTSSIDPYGYIKDMRRRDEVLSKGWGQIATPLSIQTLGGIQKMNCANTEGVFRIIQSIPSSKAEPFKLWLAKVGYERIQEIENPELAQKRMKELYRQKGYSEEWIEKRIRGILVRQELTDEWKKREINENKEFAILTDEISKAAFGKSIEEYRQFKNLKKENLKDHMTDLELIFNMLGEKVTTEITKAKDSKGLEKSKQDAKEGGEVAGNARKDAEKRISKQIISDENYLDAPEKIKRKRL